jgi:hypothetical protein
MHPITSLMCLFSLSPDTISKKENIGNVSTEFFAQHQGNGWIGEARFTANGMLQLPSNEAMSSKKQTKQAAARLILKRLDRETPKGSSDSEFLHSYCGQQKVKQVEYVIGDEKDDAGNFGCVIIWEELKNDSSEIVLKGSVCSSSDDAIVSVRKLVCDLLERVQGFDFKSSGVKCKQNTIRNEEGSSSLPCKNGAVIKQNLSTLKKSCETKEAKVAKGETLSSPAKSTKQAAESSQAIENFIGKVKEILQKDKDLEIVDENVTENEDKKFKHILRMKAKNFRESPPKTYPSKKTAEKSLALFIMKKLYPETSVSIENAKNALQEKFVQMKKPVPKYTDRGEVNAQISSCEFEFDIESSELPSKKEAKQDAYKQVLAVLT